MGSFRGVGSVGRGARIGLWLAIVALLAGGGVGAATVPRSGGGNATADDLALLRRAPAALLNEAQVQATQEMSVPSGMTMTCRLIRPASRCEQNLPGGVRTAYVTAPDGYFLEVPEPRRASTQGKAWVRVEGRGGAGSIADGYAAVLREAKDATVRHNEPLDGALVTYYRFATPPRQVSSSQVSSPLPADATMSSVIEAYVDSSGRPLRIVQDMSMRSNSTSMDMTMTITFTYGPVEPFAVPSASEAMTVPSTEEATRLVFGR